MDKIKFSQIKLFTLAAIAVLAITTLFHSTCAFSKTRAPEDIEIPAKDEFVLTGTITIPSGASIKHKAPLVIFLHSIGDDRTAWKSLPAQMNGLGLATLNLDMRGHGKSIVNKYGKNRYWMNFKKEEFGKYPEDVTSSIKYIKENYPEINTSKIAIIGGDIGANTSIIAASKLNGVVKALVLISPSMEDKGLSTALPIVAVGSKPILFIVSTQDIYSYGQSKELIKFAQGKKQLVALKYGGMGDDIIKNNKTASPIIIKWISQNFAAKK